MEGLGAAVPCVFRRPRRVAVGACICRFGTYAGPWHLRLWLCICVTVTSCSAPTGVSSVIIGCSQAGFTLLAFFALKNQDGMTRYFSVHEALDIAEAVLVAELMTTAALFTLTRLDGIPRSMPLIHGLLLAAGVIAVRMLVRVVFSANDEIPDYRCRRERIILIGANPFAAAFIQMLKAYAPQQQTVIAVLDQDTGIRRASHLGNPGVRDAAGT